MKSSDLLKELMTPPVCSDGTCSGETEEEESETEGLYDDEDFWEAIDLLETSRKAILTTLKRLKDSPDLTNARRQILNNHCDDIAQFLSFFIEVPEKPEEGEK